MLKGFLAKIFSKYIYCKNKNWINNPIKYQNRIFKDLIKKGLNTSFGNDNDFKNIKSYKDFVQKQDQHHEYFLLLLQQYCSLRQESTFQRLRHLSLLPVQ